MLIGLIILVEGSLIKAQFDWTGKLIFLQQVLLTILYRFSAVIS